MLNNKQEIDWNKRNAFSGEYFFLSNFYDSPVEYHGYMYLTAEHAFAAQKTSIPSQRSHIAMAENPATAKMRGKRCTLRTDWEEIKNEIMLTIIRDKFTRHQDIQKKLLDTGFAELVEWNSWGDDYWGKVIVGVSAQGQAIEYGHNVLGKILMRVRTEIRESGNLHVNK